LHGSLLLLGFLWLGEDLFSDPMGSLSAGAALLGCPVSVLPHQLDYSSYSLVISMQQQREKLLMFPLKLSS
jgi:hypothetical protein